MRTLLVIISIVTLGVSGASAQARRCPPPTGEPYLVCQVDSAPRPDTLNAIPRYPELLARGGSSGSVRFTMVVDSTGRPDAASFTVVDSSHVMFVSAVKAAARTWRFQPAVKAGRPVNVRWEQIVSFATPPANAPLGTAQFIQQDSADASVPRIHVGIGAPQPTVITKFTAAELLEVQRQAFRMLAPPPSVDSAGNARITLCVNVSRGSQEDAADSGTLAVLSATGRRAVIPRDCPKTYSGMMWTQERPPIGYVDPYAMSVVRLGAWNADVLVMQVEVVQGSRTHAHQCWAKRQTPSWSMQCKPTVSTVY